MALRWYRLTAAGSPALTGNKLRWFRLTGSGTGQPTISTPKTVYEAGELVTVTPVNAAAPHAYTYAGGQLPADAAVSSSGVLTFKAPPLVDPRQVVIGYKGAAFTTITVHEASTLLGPNGIPVTSWASIPDAFKPDVPVVIPAAAPTYRGINLSGAEFAHDAAHLPGVADTDYMWPAAADWTYLASRGHKVVRLPFRWERVQPTLGGALNAAELGRLTTALSRANAAGLKVIPDVHNYARFIESAANGGQERVLGGTLTTAHLTDLWGRLSAALKSNPAVYAYGLMNEPHSLTPSAGAFAGTSRYDWNDGTVQGWTGDAATATNVSGRLNLAATATAGFFQFRKDDGGLKRGGALAGNVLSAVITLGAGIAGSWSAKVQWQNSSYQWQTASAITYTRVDTGATVAGLIPGVAVRVNSNFATNPITNPNAFAVQIESNNATAGPVSVAVDDFAQGSLSGASTEAQVWEQASQAVVSALRTSGDTTTVLVPGYQFSGAQNWVTNHPNPWITDPAAKTIYEAHYYFDRDNEGNWKDESFNPPTDRTYAQENADAVARGFTSLTNRAVVELSRFTSWCTTKGVKGFVGELGWPNVGDTASWNAVGEALYDVLDDAGIGATYWAAGSWYGTTYNLSAYTGTPLAVAASPSAVIEAHPSGLAA